MSIRKIIVALSLTIPLLVLCFGEYYWQQISEWAPVVLLSFILLLLLANIVFTIHVLVKLRKNWKSARKVYLIPAILCITTLVLVKVSPKWMSPEYYLSKVVYRGCYEGTMNTGRIVFRESGDFEYSHVGFFGATTFKKGSWTRKADTLLITSEDIIPEFVGDTLILTEDRFVRVTSDTNLLKKPGFYRGYCKGLN